MKSVSKFFTLVTIVTLLCSPQSCIGGPAAFSACMGTVGGVACTTSVGTGNNIAINIELKIIEDIWMMRFWSGETFTMAVWNS